MNKKEKFLFVAYDNPSEILGRTELEVEMDEDAGLPKVNPVKVLQALIYNGIVSPSFKDVALAPNNKNTITIIHGGQYVAKLVRENKVKATTQPRIMGSINIDLDATTWRGTFNR